MAVVSRIVGIESESDISGKRPSRLFRVALTDHWGSQFVVVDRVATGDLYHVDRFAQRVLEQTGLMMQVIADGHERYGRPDSAAARQHRWVSRLESAFQTCAGEGAVEAARHAVVRERLDLDQRHAERSELEARSIERFRAAKGAAFDESSDE